MLYGNCIAATVCDEISFEFNLVMMLRSVVVLYTNYTVAYYSLLSQITFYNSLILQFNISENRGQLSQHRPFFNGYLRFFAVAIGRISLLGHGCLPVRPDDTFQNLVSYSSGCRAP